VREALLAELEAIVGERDVLADPELRAGYEVDWTGRWRGRCLAVVRPGDVDEVGAVLRACAAHGAPVVPQGGNTGLVGGATPDARGAAVVLASTRLDDLGEVDVATRQIACGAGVTLARLQATAAAAGLQAGLDLAARDSATIGGLAACNAGGLQAVRYGTARRRIAGLEAVLADGSVVRRMSGLPKDNAGYDLAQLLIGSEGTLGVITRVLWSAAPRFDERALALVAAPSSAAAVAAARELLVRLPSLEMLEIIDEAAVQITVEHLAVEPPVPATAAWVLVGCAGSSDPQEELAMALYETGLADDTVVAVDATRRARLLTFRESVTEAVGAAGIPHKMDVGVPLARLVAFLDELPHVVADAAPGARTFVYGHLGDGNMHVNVLGPEPDDEAADDAVLQLAARCGGTITAEHGVGRHKARHLALVRSQGERAAMAAIKRALDPRGLLNPGVVLA
jgi:FAD/FMN-containing dehydrogenase